MVVCAMLTAHWKSPGIFLQGDIKKKSCALSINLVSEARLNPSLIRRWDVKLKFWQRKEPAVYICVCTELEETVCFGALSLILELSEWCC